MREITILDRESNQRLDKWLIKYLGKAPKSFVYKMLRKKNIKLNKKKASGNEILTEGDLIQLYFSEETFASFNRETAQKINSRLDIIYEDNHILIINKPAGLLSQKSSPSDISLVEHLISYMMESGQVKEEELNRFKPSICNRLDRNTSGIVIAGKTLAGLQAMSELLKRRTVHKYYRCIAAGEITKDRNISGFLIKDRHANKVKITREEQPGSSYIETEYKPVSIQNKTTLLEVKLITGRSHQIRAHLAGTGHPIIGDSKYGNEKYNHHYKKQYGVTHQLLHSYRIEFPALKGEFAYLSGQSFLAPLPDIYQKILS